MWRTGKNDGWMTTTTHMIIVESRELFEPRNSLLGWLSYSKKSCQKIRETMFTFWHITFSRVFFSVKLLHCILFSIVQKSQVFWSQKLKSDNCNFFWQFVNSMWIIIIYFAILSTFYYLDRKLVKTQGSASVWTTAIWRIFPSAVKLVCLR